MIISIINQKGGVGKSTTANALGAGLSLRGYKVLYIDLDAQGNLSYSMNALGKKDTTNSIDVLMNAAKGVPIIKNTIVHTEQGDIVPAAPTLASADLMLTNIGKEYTLKYAIEPIRDDYDVIVIDTPPALGILAVNALTASDSVVVPAQADAYSLQGIGMLHQTVLAVRRYCNSDLKISGILITRYSSRAILTRQMTQMMEDTAEKLHTVVYRTKIRECIALKEAQAAQQSIFEYAPKSNASIDYNAFIDELLHQQPIERK